MKYKYYLLIGALTSKPYAFTARSWELKNVETIDLFDSLCSNIRIDIRGSEILRVLPVTNQYLNEEWISDKTRYAYDGLKRWRFVTPLIKKDNTFINISWQEVLLMIKDKIQTTNFNKFIINTGNYCDLETIVALNKFSQQFNHIIINSDSIINANKQNYFLNLKEFNNTFGYKLLILVGLNLRLENPILNIKLKKTVESQNILTCFIGSKYDFNFNLIHLGNNFITLLKIFQGKHYFINKIFSFLKKDCISYKFKNNISVIFGQECINQKNFYLNLTKLDNLNNKFFNFNFNYVSSSSGKLNALELGFFNNKQEFTINNENSNKIYYLIGTENCEYLKKNDFVIFQGHHNDKMRTNFNVILPTITWIEKSSLYFNIFGIIQKTNNIITAPVNSRIDWKIIRMFSILYNRDINFNSIKDIHKKINELSPNIINSLSNYSLQIKYLINYNKILNKKLMVNINPTKSYTYNYYRLNSVERSSKIMKNCSISFNNYKNNFYK